MEYIQLFTLLPFQMPDHIQYQRPAGVRQDGINFQDQGIPIEELSEADAYNYAEEIKKEFLKKWNSKQEGRLPANQQAKDLREGAPVEFPVPARMQFGEIETLYNDGTAKVRIWICNDDNIKIHRFEEVNQADIVLLER